MSTADRRLSIPLRPVFIPQLDKTEPPRIQAIIDKLQMNRHLEGGYFVETDRDPLRVPNPFRPTHSAQHESAHQDTDDATRNASTTIFYMLTPANPTGVFHRNKARTMHTLHMGRGCYIIIHADEVLEGQSARVETFLVGHDIQAGEKLQWLVEGGKYKASFLLPDSLDTGESQGLLISEVQNVPETKPLQPC